MEIYSTEELIGVIYAQEPLVPYWLNFFPGEMTFEREQIDFDMVGDDRRLAPFVAPNVQGKVMRDKGYTTKSFKPAYVKPKHVVDPSRAIKRRAGEPLLGTLSLQDRFDAVVAENLMWERKAIERRLEWMAAQAVIHGAVTVVGDDYPAVTVDFGRDPSLTIALAGAAKWVSTNTGVNPLKDLEDARRQVHRLAKSGVTRLTFGLDAWDAFTSFDTVRELLHNTYRGSDTEFNRAVSDGSPQEYRGFISGQNGMGRLELWTYDDEYEEENGTMVPFLDSGTVVGTGPGLQGVQCFGAIRDRAALRAMRMFPKMYEENDPSTVYTLTQSAPLVVPAQPNACFAMKVV
jgi:hypothetical protein